MKEENWNRFIILPYFKTDEIDMAGLTFFDRELAKRVLQVTKLIIIIIIIIIISIAIARFENFLLFL